MTSSLVGSEMCIRDRQKPGEPLVVDATDTFPPTHFVFNWKGTRPHARFTCLLYTSDAADDM
eukprot:3343866-Prorocentrum_lima.AAC.1